jgi:hypothetical protein
MGYDGNGTYNRPVSSYVFDTVISETDMNTEMDGLCAGLSNVVCKDGQSTTTARIPFASGISTDTVNEQTSGSGVTIDSVLLKDGKIDTAQGSDIASASSVDIGAATGNYVKITGTTPITAFASATAGRWRWVEFTGALTLTHNATSLILPGGANITTAAGDTALFVSEGSGNWRCLAYQKSNGAPVLLADGSVPNAKLASMSNLTVKANTSGSSASPSDVNAATLGASWVLLSTQTASSSATLDFTSGLDSTYDQYRFVLTDVLAATDAVDLWLRISQDGGSTWLSGASSYIHARNALSASATNTPAGSATGDAKIVLAASLSNNAGRPIAGEIQFSTPSGLKFKYFRSNLAFDDSSNSLKLVTGAGYYAADGNAITGVRFLMSSGNIASGSIALYGLRKA